MTSRFITWLQKKAFRVFTLPTVTRITIAQSVLDDLSVMAQEAHPKEMLAFFASSRGNKHGHVHIDEIQLQAYNASGDSAHVLLSNLPMTTSIIGTVHSHPGGSKRPSDADLLFFSKFGFVHAILGEPYRTIDIAFYDKSGRRIAVEIITNSQK